jgi:hypothetical protein
MSTERIALTQPIESRDGTLSKDSRSVNGVFETRDQKRELVKRPGLSYWVTLPATTGYCGMGAFNNSTSGLTGLIAVSFTYNPVGSSYYTIQWVRTEQGYYGAHGSLGTQTTSWSDVKPMYFGNMTNDRYVVFHDISQFMFVDLQPVFPSLTPTFSGAITMPGAANTLVPGVACLDGYCFVGYAQTNRIYNCDLGDPVTWNALNYITFEQSGDTLVAIAKHLNYVVAYGRNTTQFYYDAGNPTGSPLALAGSYSLEIGCAEPGSIVSAENTVFWIGSTTSNGRAVYMLEGVSPVRISTHAIEKVLDKYVDKFEQDTSADYVAKAHCYKYSGHTLYVLTLVSNTSPSAGPGITLVFDVAEKMWTQWTQYTVASGESYMVSNKYFASNKTIPYTMDNAGVLYKYDINTYQDNSQAIYYRAVTDKVDNGSTKRKFYGRLEVVGDKISGGTMQIRHSGDDYTTWSSYRSIDLNAPRAQIQLGGSDRRRAWEFLVTSNVPLRLDSVEIDYRSGEMDQEQSIGGGAYRR